MEGPGEFGAEERHGLIEVLGRSYWLLCGAKLTGGQRAVGRPAGQVRGDGPRPGLAIVEVESGGHEYTHAHLNTQGPLPPDRQQLDS